MRDASRYYRDKPSCRYHVRPNDTCPSLEITKNTTQDNYCESQHVHPLPLALLSSIQKWGWDYALRHAPAYRERQAVRGRAVRPLTTWFTQRLIRACFVARSLEWRTNIEREIPPPPPFPNYRLAVQSYDGTEVSRMTVLRWVTR